VERGVGVLWIWCCAGNFGTFRQAEGTDIKRESQSLICRVRLESVLIIWPSIPATIICSRRIWGLGRTYIIDLRTNKVVATVKDTPCVEGIEYIPELKKFYTSNAGGNTIGVVDLRQMKVVKKLPTEEKPDGSTYAAPFHKLYVSD
jgi:hypothetical protein